MKGFVPTPDHVVDLMVERLFSGHPPRPGSRVLDPGCGRGAFIDGLLRWSNRHGAETPIIVGIESDPTHADYSARRFAGNSRVEVRHAEFLRASPERFDYVVGNPPYVPITGLSPAERTAYRTGYATASGRFDLYLLFFEQAVSMLADAGRLVFITPEKYLYVDSARPLRRLLGTFGVEELRFLDELTFGELVTYPLISTVTREVVTETLIIHRDGRQSSVQLTHLGLSWLPTVNDIPADSATLRLGDVCRRISCGVATGADGVFIIRNADLEPDLRVFAHPTIAGRQIKQTGLPRSMHSILVPYTVEGGLLAEDSIGALGRFLWDPVRRERLLARTCVQRKPWYAFHETPPLVDILQPKLLCKDITPSPFFVVDRTGDVVPRHSVYYIVPTNPDHLDDLQSYLNGDAAQTWLRGHCQRAANGFFRLQSHVLKRLPVPEQFLSAAPTDRLARRAKQQTTRQRPLSSFRPFRPASLGTHTLKAMTAYCSYRSKSTM